MYKPSLLAFAVATLGIIANAQTPGEKQIIQELRKIRQLLEAPAEPEQPAQPVRPTRAKVDVQGAPALGVETAPITVVEFTDFQCPYCSKFHLETFPKLHNEFIATGNIRWVHRDLPLPPQMHPNAQQSAEAGRCAGDQGHFWEMRDWMQSNPTKLSVEELQAHATDLGLDLGQYRSCMATGKHRAEVKASADEAQKLGITGTPAFVIGKSGATVEGEVIVGAQPLANFEAKLNALLK